MADTRQGSADHPADAREPEGSHDRWLDRHLWEIQPIRDVLVVLGVLFLLWLGQTISIVTVPLLLAMLFAYLMEPVVRFVMRRARLERTAAVVSILVATVVLVLVPAILASVFGIVQGVGLVSGFAQRSALVYESVEAQRSAGSARATLDNLQGRWDRQQAESPQAGGVVPEDESADKPAPGGESEVEPGAEISGAEGLGTEGPEAEGEASEPLPPVSVEELSRARQAFIEARGEAQRKRIRVRDEGGDAWLWVHDRLVRTDESGTLDAAFRVFQGWLEQNATQLARSAAATSANVLQTTLAFLARAFAIFFMLFLTAFFFFFMATQWPNVNRFIDRLIPEKHAPLIGDLALKFDRVINAFIRGRLTIAFLQSIVFTIGYFAIGVPAAFILGPVVAILSIVPYLASVGIPISVGLLWFEDLEGLRGTWWFVLGAPVAFYFFAQALDDYVWTPMIQGKTTEMSTPAILFASIAGGVLFGFFGLLIAIPLAACLKILVVEVFWPVFRDWSEGKRKDLLPFGRSPEA